MLKKTINLITLLSLAPLSCLLASPLGNTVFNIAPSISNTTISSIEETNIEYTVTNQSSATLPNISVIPSYLSTGRALSVYDNNCSSLAAAGSCTFKVLIPSGQSSSFTLTPKVCAFNGFLCSQPSTAVNVNVVSHTLPTRAYEVVNPSIGDVPISATLVGVNLADVEDIISAPSSLGYSGSINGVAVSKDGSRVYVSTYQNISRGSTVEIQPEIAVFEVSSNTITHVLDIPLGSASVVVRQAGKVGITVQTTEVALTPDDSTLFVTVDTGSSAHSAGNLSSVSGSLYRISNIQTNSPVVTPITGDVINQPGGIVVSPDGQTVYVATQNNDYILAFPVGATALTTSNKIATGFIADDAHPGLAISPAGNMLYIGNQTSGTITALNLESLASGPTTIDPEAPGAVIIGVAVSEDGDQLFFSNYAANQVYSWDLADSDGIIQPEVFGAFGVSISPNGAQLVVTQSPDTSPYVSTIFNANVFLETPIAAELDGPVYTVGAFAG